MKKSQLEIKVLAINTLNEYAQKCFEYEKKHFSQFIGQKIFKVDGNIKAKFDHKRLTFKGKMDDGTFYNVHYWFTSNSRHFDMNIKLCINGGSYDVRPATAFCQYEETHPTLFEVDAEGALKPTTQQPNDYTIRYSVADLQAIAENIKAAAEAYSHAEDKMPHYFRDVLYIQRLSR